MPHNEKRFVGYDKSSKKFDAETLCKYIYGGHVEEYMETMEEEEPEKYQVCAEEYLCDAGDAAIDDADDLTSLCRGRSASPHLNHAVSFPQAHFAKYIAAGIEVGEMEELYKGVSVACRLRVREILWVAAHAVTSVSIAFIIRTIMLARVPPCTEPCLPCLKARQCVVATAIAAKQSTRSHQNSEVSWRAWDQMGSMLFAAAP